MHHFVGYSEEGAHYQCGVTGEECILDAFVGQVVDFSDPAEGSEERDGFIARVGAPIPAAGTMVTPLPSTRRAAGLPRSSTAPNYLQQGPGMGSLAPAIHAPGLQNVPPLPPQPGVPPAPEPWWAHYGEMEGGHYVANPTPGASFESEAFGSAEDLWDISQGLATPEDLAAHGGIPEPSPVSSFLSRVPLLRNFVGQWAHGNPAPGHASRPQPKKTRPKSQQADLGARGRSCRAHGTTRQDYECCLAMQAQACADAQAQADADARAQADFERQMQMQQMQMAMIQAMQQAQQPPPGYEYAYPEGGGYSEEVSEAPYEGDEEFAVSGFVEDLESLFGIHGVEIHLGAGTPYWRALASDHYPPDTQPPDGTLKSEVSAHPIQTTKDGKYSTIEAEGMTMWVPALQGPTHVGAAPAGLGEAIGGIAGGILGMFGGVPELGAPIGGMIGGAIQGGVCGQQHGGAVAMSRPPQTKTVGGVTLTGSFARDGLFQPGPQPDPKSGAMANLVDMTNALLRKYTPGGTWARSTAGGTPPSPQATVKGGADHPRYALAAEDEIAQVGAWFDDAAYYVQHKVEEGVDWLEDEIDRTHIVAGGPVAKDYGPYSQATISNLLASLRNAGFDVQGSNPYAIDTKTHGVKLLATAHDSGVVTVAITDSDIFATHNAVWGKIDPMMPAAG